MTFQIIMIYNEPQYPPEKCFTKSAELAQMLTDAQTHVCMTVQELRNSCFISLLCFQSHHSPPGACWFTALTSNLLPAISACGGWDGVSCSHISSGFSPFTPPGCETNLPTWAYDPVRRLLCNTAAKAPHPTPTLPRPPAVALPWILKTVLNAEYWRQMLPGCVFNLF